MVFYRVGKLTVGCIRQTTALRLYNHTLNGKTEVLLKAKIACRVQGRVLEVTQFPAGDNGVNTNNKIQLIDPLTPAGLVDLGRVDSVSRPV